eukprot:TRINITY_DN5442_c0_g1_i1.p1 TRINITY_DN5442_c0_g1~~TRINITY_DN5442_c0_g1_i1.p1  ORF type:complete len:183 (+),score=38.70 TRINITY_DN5442_c0_g1_i1:73-549(+)
MVLAIGFRGTRGHQVTKRARKARFCVQKAHAGPQRVLVKDVIAEVSGSAPYEKRIMELLRNGLDKRALKLAKRRMGTHLRGKRKREELSTVVMKVRLERDAKRAEHEEAMKKARKEKKERLRQAKMNKNKGKKPVKAEATKPAEAAEAKPVEKADAKQ